MTTIHYLDTSALVKLIVYPDLKDKEKGSEKLYKFRKQHTGFHTLDLCIGEALNVLKQKTFSRSPRRQLIFPHGYLICIERLLTFIKPQHTIHIRTTDLNDINDKREASILVKEFDLDFVDALVIIKAKNHRPYSYEQNLLITGDQKMQKAAGAKDLNVWNCAKQEAPS